MVEGDLRHRIRPIRAVLASALVLAVTAVVAGCGTGSPEAARGATHACGDAVLRDWADGSISRTHATECYLEAIASLPEDVRAYTSAEDDITRALQAHVDDAPTTQRYLSAARAEAAAPTASSALRLPPVPVLILGGGGIVLLAAALAVAVVGLTRKR